MFRLKQAQENKDGDEIRDCVVIDMKKFEQDLYYLNLSWREFRAECIK